MGEWEKEMGKDAWIAFERWMICFCEIDSSVLLFLHDMRL